MFANKQDLASALSVTDITKKLGKHFGKKNRGMWKRQKRKEVGEGGREKTSDRKGNQTATSPTRGLTNVFFFPFSLILLVRLV